MSMTPTLLLPILVLGCALSVGPVFGQETREQPAVAAASTPHLDFIVNAESLEDLVQVADAVVVGEIRQREMAIRPTPIGARTVVTEYQLIVEETVKDDGHVVPASKTLPVLVVGGEFSKGSFQANATDIAPPLRSAERTVLFLRWWPAAGVHVLLGNAAGAFRLSETEVTPLLEQSPVARNLLTRDSLLFVNAAKRAAGRKTRP